MRRRPAGRVRTSATRSFAGSLHPPSHLRSLQGSNRILEADPANRREAGVRSRAKPGIATGNKCQSGVKIDRTKELLQRLRHWGLRRLVSRLWARTWRTLGNPPLKMALQA